MRFFGRKANSESTKLPPELKPYYQPSRGAQFRRAGLLILPLVTAVVLIGALIGGGVWLVRRHEKPQGATSSKSTQNNQEQTKSAPPKPAPKPAEKPSPTPSVPSIPDTNLVNTGPDGTVVVLAGLLGTVAGTALHIRQRRTVRS